MLKNNESVNFLDLKLYKNNNNILTDIYRKPTDNLSYVPFNSYHPSHVKRNIPYNLFRRIYLLVTDPKIINNRINELKFHLKGLKYPHSLIMDAINKAKGNLSLIHI